MTDTEPATGWQQPEYVDATLFTETDVEVFTDDYAARGSLTVPRTPSNAAVVLLGGGGPIDADATSGPNKPMRDLAWGLASRGIASVRTDKVTFTRPELPSRSGFTLTEEYVPTSRACIRLLRERVGDVPVFVLGHSMGGRAAPRVAAAEPSLAGLVLMAADAEPMHEATVRVLDHLAATEPDAVPAETAATLRRQVEAVASANLAATTPAADLPYGFGGSYWLDLRDDDPVARAAALDLPMLILQGGRDYQVTVDSDLSLWRRGLGNQDRVTIQILDRDDHMFYPGEGPSRLAGYAAPQHVDVDAIDTIATWIGSIVSSSAAGQSAPDPAAPGSS